MGSNEDYLDNLLQSMLAEEGEAEAQKSLIDSGETDNAQENEEVDLDALLNSLEGIEDIVQENAQEKEQEETEEAEKDIWAVEEDAAAEEQPEKEQDETGEDQAETKMLSPEEIEAMFAQMDAEEALEAGQESDEKMYSDEELQEDDAESGESEDDLLAMLEGMEEQDPDLNEINSLLEKSDHHEAVDDDVMALLDEDEEAQVYPAFEMDEAEQTDSVDDSEASEKPEKSRRKRKERKKREKVKAPKEKAVKEKKEGFFSRLFKALTEEEEKVNTADTYDMNAENEAILQEMEQEDAATIPEKKGKKPKKEKKKKEKEPKKEKAKKEKKPKKEKVKKEKVPKAPAPKGKPLPKKKTAVVVLFAATVFAAVMLFSDFVPGIMEIRKAREAFEQADYETTFALLAGREHREEEENIYQASLLVAQMQRSMDSYLNYQRMGMDIQALDALIKGIGKYEEVSAEAGELGIQSRVDEIYTAILSALDSAYGISEDEAKEIFAEKEDDVYYTIALKRVLGMEIPAIGHQGTESADGMIQEVVSEEDVPQEDMLDAENDFLNDY
ncbi:MAG: hypothetical protein J6B10_00030 [Lachnospiraceae bacterium]|nr:hypothetical protein [Lachnospiraceae bacterium]